MEKYVAFSLLFILTSCTAEAWRPRRFLRQRSHNFSLSKGQNSIPNSQFSILNSEYEYETKYFTQRLDHFSFKKHANSTFQQRYLINDKHWVGAQAKGPIFLYCGNEGYIEWFAVNSGFIWDIAPQFGALLVFPEHRYYGTSMPYGSHDVAYKDGDSLAYLTAEQAIADFATLILDLKKNLSAEASPVVLFGGSYGGMLAAWMRLKYPHIAIGALSSSAPILQFEDIVPWDTFYDIVSTDFRVHNSLPTVFFLPWKLVCRSSMLRSHCQTLFSDCFSYRKYEFILKLCIRFNKLLSFRNEQLTMILLHHTARE